MTSVRALPRAEQYPSRTASSSAGTSSLTSGIFIGLNSGYQGGDLACSLKRRRDRSSFPARDQSLASADVLCDLDLGKSRTTKGEDVGLSSVHAGNYTLVNSLGNTLSHNSPGQNAQMSLRENLKALMELHKDNPYSLHLKIGVPQPTIFRIVEGTTQNPKRITLEKIARHYHVKVEDLFGTTAPVKDDAAVGRLAIECAEIIDTLPYRAQVEMLHHLRVEQRKISAVNAMKVPRPGRPDADDSPTQ